MILFKKISSGVVPYCQECGKPFGVVLTQKECNDFEDDCRFCNNYLKKNKTPKKTKKFVRRVFSPEEKQMLIEEVKKLRNNGFTYSYISKELGVNESTAFKWSRL